MKIHYLFTDRRGGQSHPPYDSLNLALHVGDDPSTVTKNREHLRRHHSLAPIVWMDQVHGAHIRSVCAPNPSTQPSCDALISDQPGIALAVMVADCIPLLLYEPHRKVIAAVHAGRNGTFLHIATKCVQTMTHQYGANPSKIHAIMGPSIHNCCYEVGEDLASIVKRNFGEKYMNGRYLDLIAINKEQLRQVGIPASQIIVDPRCSCCDKTFFSYRREGRTGRFAGIIWMSP